jgi:SAM-dependent methyltransferase
MSEGEAEIDQAGEARPNAFAADPAALALASYNQNFETFRALNALMWQIPLIAMTLTGGLWFGVSKVEAMPVFRLGLLALALCGNVGLIFVLERLRHIIGRYLDWLRDAYPRGHVSAPGAGWMTRNRTVKLVFQLMLGFAAAISSVLFAATVHTLNTTDTAGASGAAVAWYDAHANQLADGYESLDAAATHPKLFASLHGAAPMRVLDVGAGTGRDAAALAALGNKVVAVEPSMNMLRLARRLHPGGGLVWLGDDLPDLPRTKGPFDLVLLSAVWMHVRPHDRQRAFHRLSGLTAPKGRIYMTLRMGPDDAERGMYSVGVDELRRLGVAEKLTFEDLGEMPDLLGRDAVRWRTVQFLKS